MEHHTGGVPRRHHWVEAMTPIRVMLVDDHALVRAGFRALLQDIERIEVVAEAGDGQDALRLIKAIQPDIVLMNITMPGLNGLDVTARVAKSYPNVRVIILSMHAHEEYVLQALQVGAVGYLLKNASPDELELALRIVQRGKIYLNRGLSEHIITDYVRRIRSQSGTPSAEHSQGLSARQREVLALIAEGYTNKQIAKRLNLSVKTIETHRMQLMERLDIHDIAGLVRYAIRIGLVTVDGQVN